MSRFFIVFAYDGSVYKGFQRQERVSTIEKELMRVLKIINKKKEVFVYASGRTDTGVHALRQTAHFDLDINIAASNLKEAINSLLKKDIYIIETKEVAPEFHARYDAKSKEYMYKINIGEYNPFEHKYIYQLHKDLNVTAMRRALGFLRGEHNFKSFTSLDKNEKNKDCVRNIYRFQIKKDRDIVTIFIQGSGFLRYMVRNITGTLIEVGKGKIKPEEMIKILKAKDRKAAGPTAPPEGLYLREVYY